MDKQPESVLLEREQEFERLLDEDGNSRAVGGGPLVANGGGWTALEIEKLLAEWRECEQRLEEDATSPEREALDARCARLAETYRAAVRSRANQQRS